MKKLSTTMSPFLMLIIPVIMIIGLSLVLKSENSEAEEFTGTSYSQTKTLEKVSASVLINILADKF